MALWQQRMIVGYKHSFILGQSIWINIFQWYISMSDEMILVDDFYGYQFLKKK